MISPAEVAVLYVARGGEGGMDNLLKFVQAYREHPAGVDHEVILLAKRWSARERVEVGQIGRELKARVIDLPDEGFDWGAYARGSQLVGNAFVCLLNSHSRPIAPGWLAKIVRAAKTPGVGMAGASGSWESPVPDLRIGGISWFTRCRLLLHVVRNFSYYNKFNSFPNRHLRSNAVVLRRSLLTRFFVHVDMPRTKRQAHVIESGKTGLSANLASNGLRLVVAGRDDIIYPDSQWPLASTFRSGTQHNLLVADNRTQSYDNSSSDSKRHLESITWGAPPSQD